MHAKRYDRTGKSVVFRLGMKPQTNGFHEFVFVLFCCHWIVYSWRRSTATDGRCKDNTSKDPFEVWISSRNSRTVQNWVNDYSDKNFNWRHEAQNETQQCVKWPETLGEHVCLSVVDANAWVFMHWRSFVFVVSLFLLSVCVVVLWLSSLIDTHTVAQVCVLFAPSSSSCFMRTVSDFFDLSIHFISYLFISLIFCLFLLPYTLLPYTFYFRDVVDNMPAHFRWGAGPPGQKESLQRSFVVWVWRERSSDQDDFKGKKSLNETCFQNPQSCSWLMIRPNQVRHQNPNKIYWHQKPTRRHTDQGKFHTWRMESSFVFVEN